MKEVVPIIIAVVVHVYRIRALHIKNCTGRCSKKAAREFGSRIREREKNIHGLLNNRELANALAHPQFEPHV
jgi:hypothetical protein